MDLVPAEGFKGLFTYEPVEDTIYQMVNQVDTSVYGCIERIQWDVYKAGSDTLVKSVSAWSPKIDFPEPGKYRVVLNVGAPGDLFSADELVIDVEEVGGCSTAPASGGLVGIAKNTSSEILLVRTVANQKLVFPHHQILYWLLHFLNYQTQEYKGLIDWSKTMKLMKFLLLDGLLIECLVNLLKEWIQDKVYSLLYLMKLIT